MLAKDIDPRPRLARRIQSLLILTLKVTSDLDTQPVLQNRV